MGCEMAEIETRITGLDNVVAQLRAVPVKLRVRAIRNALAAGARIVRDDARQGAPVLSQADPRRTAGTVRDAIVVRTSKQARQAGDVGVFVNVRPLKASQVRAFKASGGKAASNPRDPFYWRWLEFGRQGRGGSASTASRRVARHPGDRAARYFGAVRFIRPRKAQRAVGALPAVGFLQRSARRLGDALRRFVEVLGPAIEKLNNRGQTP